MNSALDTVPDVGSTGNIIMPEEFRKMSLETENQRLRAQNACQQMQIRHLRQILIALGDVNRYHASNALGRHATESEAILHFIEKGGAADFNKSHPAPG